MIIFISLPPLASVCFLNWSAVLNKKQDDQSFLFLIVSYKVLTASSITSTTESYKSNLPKFVKSTSNQGFVKAGKQHVHLDVSHGFKQ